MSLVASDDSHLTYMAHVRANWDLIDQMKKAIRADDPIMVADITVEQDERDRRLGLEGHQRTWARLWKATTKGGVWERHEREYMHSDKVAKAMRER